MVLYDDETGPLLTSKYWVRPLYQEILHAASRFNSTQVGELKCPVTRLVKILTHQRVKVQATANLSASHANMQEWIGAECPVDFLNVWFPAHWVPMVLEAMVKSSNLINQNHYSSMKFLLTIHDHHLYSLNSHSTTIHFSSSPVTYSTTTFFP